MKFQLSTALMGLAATAVSAQEQQSGPFALHVKGTNPNSTIDGKVQAETSTKCRNGGH